MNGLICIGGPLDGNMFATHDRDWFVVAERTSLPAFPLLSEPGDEEIKQHTYRRHSLCGVYVFAHDSMRVPDIIEKLVHGYKP